MSVPQPLNHGMNETDQVTRTISQATGRPAAMSDVVATLTDVTGLGLAAVTAAQCASIAWARGRWLTGQAPPHPVVATLDALQATLGNGPSLHALRTQRAVTISDTDHETRWPVFGARAAELGVGSMMSLPLSVRAEGFGVLNLYAARPHAFTGDDETWPRCSPPARPSPCTGPPSVTMSRPWPSGIWPRGAPTSRRRTTTWPASVFPVWFAAWPTSTATSTRPSTPAGQPSSRGGGTR